MHAATKRALRRPISNSTLKIVGPANCDSPSPPTACCTLDRPQRKRNDTAARAAVAFRTPELDLKQNAASHGGARRGKHMIIAGTIAVTSCAGAPAVT